MLTGYTGACHCRSCVCIFITEVKATVVMLLQGARNAQRIQMSAEWPVLARSANTSAY